MTQTTQLSNWTGFEQEVRHGTAPVFGDPIGFVPPVPANEYHVVATESGVSARFVENISQVIGAVFEAQGLNFRFGDSPAGPDVRFTTKPDAIIEDLRAPGRALVVGELKTPWTRPLDVMPDTELAQLLGQIARYMDDYGCMDGFLSTYERHARESTPVRGTPVRDTPVRAHP